MSTHSMGYRIWGKKEYLFGCASYDSQRQTFWTFEAIPLGTYEVPLSGIIFNKAAFCLGERQGMLTMKCGFWCNRVGDFLCLFGIEERKYWFSFAPGKFCYRNVCCCNYLVFFKSIIIIFETDNK